MKCSRHVRPTTHTAPAVTSAATSVAARVGARGSTILGDCTCRRPAAQSSAIVWVTTRRYISLGSIQDACKIKIETCEFQISSFEVSRLYTFTMAGQNFDCAVGGLIIIFGSETSRALCWRAYKALVKVSLKQSSFDFGPSHPKSISVIFNTLRYANA